MLRPIGGLKHQSVWRGSRGQGGADLYVRKRNTDEPKVIPAEQMGIRRRAKPCGSFLRAHRSALGRSINSSTNRAIHRSPELASRQRAISCRSFATPRAMITARPIRWLPPDGQC